MSVEQPVIGPAWLMDDLVRVEDLLAATAGASAHPLVSEASTHLLKAGGKRLRPALCLLAARAGEPERRETDLAAAAVELVHLATLYHDDVIDETDTRRGVPTVHSKWGTEVAVLAGDYLFACASSLGADAGGQVSSILAWAIAEVCEGQIIETQTLGDPRRSVDDYLEVISKKTAALFRAACELGASTSGAGGHRRAALVTYGASLGLAFQIVDDLMDLVGHPDVTGKVPGTDLKEGVFTAPVLIACSRDVSLADRLAAGERDLVDVLPVLRSTGALDEARSVASAYAATACEALATLPDEEWSRALRDVATAVLAQGV